MAISSELNFELKYLTDRILFRRLITCVIIICTVLVCNIKRIITAGQEKNIVISCDDFCLNLRISLVLVLLDVFVSWPCLVLVMLVSVSALSWS